MKLNRFVLFLLIFVVSDGYCQSQKQLIKVGDQLYNEGDFYGASKWYKDAMVIDSSYLDLIYKYAESLRLYNDYTQAEYYYSSVYQKDMGKTYPLAPFWYSTMLKNNESYNEAKKYFKRCKRLFRDKKSYHYQKIEQEIKSCETALRIRKDSLPIDVKNIGNTINSYNSELGANLINDSILIYSSLRDERMIENNEVLDTSLYLVKLFSAKRHLQNWVSDTKLDEIINEKGFHIANGCINTKGDLFYYNKCDRNLHCNIYVIPFVNNSWGKPYEVGEVNHKNYTTTQPYITNVNGKEVLFFASNREGGEGLMDIWYSFFINGKFQVPVNAGKIVNSIDDELTPFYNAKDSILYFSSNWHEGLGGFDIFSSKTNLLKFEPLKNLGYPINTSANDFYYSIKNNTALLTSNRKGSFTKKGETCCNDIYYYEISDTSAKVFTNLEELSKYLPVKLYFHNDQPNPRSRDTLTSIDYVNTYAEYTKLINEYKKEYAQGLKGDEKEDALVDIEDLFSSYIDKGAKDLKMFTPLLLRELEEGKQISLTIKGFASPLSKSDYNVNLTLRRISSLINYLSEYDKGKLLPYINQTAKNGGSLSFIKVPYGEYQSVKEISDDLADKRNSIYSPGAAFERKIEIIAIKIQDSVQYAIDGSELEKLPLLSFKDSILTVGINEVEKSFEIMNNGEAPLKIFAGEFNVEGFEVELVKNSIQPFETANIVIRKLKTGIKKNVSVTFITNGVPNRIVKEIYIRE